MANLVAAPHGQQMLFKLTLTTLSLSLLGHLIYGIALGMLLPYVLREKMIGTAPIMAVMDYSQVALEVPAGEEATIILPPLLRLRPIWEHKTTQLSVAIQ